MIDDFDGATLVDEPGEAVGVVARTYVDDNGTARLLGIDPEGVDGQRLVPADGMHREEANVIRVPLARDAILGSPGVPLTDELDGDVVAQVRAYYAGQVDELPADELEVLGETDQRHRPANDFAEIPTQEAPEGFGQVRDLGDVIEVPIVEEVLVKKPIVREVLRIRKRTAVESGVAGADLRRERVEVVSAPDELVTDSDLPTGDTDSE